MSVHREVFSDLQNEGHSMWHSKNETYRNQLRQLLKYSKHGGIPILIEGATGTGKTRIAREIHQVSPRSTKAFRELTLSSVEDSLVGSELFGHVPGAFTDARQTRTGAFVSAAGGTLFLDEIGKASERVQMRLLGAVESGVIVPQGSDRATRVDVRIIAATNVPIERLVQEGKFLPDLAARLGMFRFTLASLRDRKEDIADIARQIVRQRATHLGFTRTPSLDDDLVRSLERAQWPWNIRQLDAALQQILLEAVETNASVLTLQHCVGDLSYLTKLVERRKAREVSASDVLGEIQPTESRAALAKRLGVSEATLYRRLRNGESENRRD